MKKLKVLVVAAAFIISGTIFSCSKLSGGEIIEISGKSEAESDSDKTDLDKADSPAADNSRKDSGEAGSVKSDQNNGLSDTTIHEETDEALKEIYVHVCGAVNSPDVYAMPEGSRVTDAIKAAGGFADDADRDYLNLADIISDGSKVYVPTKEEAESGELPPDAYSNGTVMSVSPDMTAGNNKVNINTATAEELKTLNGIGDARAADIIRYRETNGCFECIEDIKKVPGIKDAAFLKICDDITV